MIRSNTVPVMPSTTTSEVDRKTIIRLRQLMRRDGLPWGQFLRRAVEAYDLMYSRDS